MSEQIHFILVITAALILLTSLYIKKIHRSFLSEPVLVMLIGLALNLQNSASSRSVTAIP
jgi:hypothetical protein